MIYVVSHPKCPTPTHLCSHAHHVLSHCFLDFLICGAEEEQIFLKFFTFDFMVLEHFILHLCLLDHHHSHHFHLVAIFGHLLIFHVIHLLERQCLLMLQSFQSLLLCQCRLFFCLVWF